jgi:hypothetical protein
MKSHLHPWVLDDLNRLIENRVRESRYLEFKRELNLGTGDAIKEFIADVSAFANADGGVIVFGIDEKNGEADALCSFEVQDSDTLERRIKSLLTDNLDPPLRGHHCDFIPVNSTRHALVLRIPPSASSPHMITKGGPKFYQRVAAGKSPMDSRDLRNAFLSAGRLETLAQAFISNRCEKILLGDLPFRLDAKGYVVMHILPISSILHPPQFSLTELRDLVPVLGPPGRHGGCSPRVCMEGTSWASMSSEGSCISYVLLTRDGIIEVAYPSCGLNNDKNLLYESRHLSAFRDVLPTYAAAIEQVGGQPPVRIFSSFVGCDGTTPYCPPEADDSYSPSLHLTEEILILPPLEALDQPVNWIDVLRHFSDLYANRSGRLKSRYFKDDGTMVRI